MPQVKVFDMAGNEVSKMRLSKTVFGIEPNTAVMHEAVVNYLANQRQGTQSTLTRTEVRGGGRKPWRQKGTGPVETRRYRPRPQAPRLQILTQQEGKKTCSSFCTFQQGA